MIAIRMVFRGREPMFGDEIKARLSSCDGGSRIAGPQRSRALILLSRGAAAQVEWLPLSSRSRHARPHVFADRSATRIGERGVLVWKAGACSLPRRSPDAVRGTKLSCCSCAEDRGGRRKIFGASMPCAK